MSCYICQNKYDAQNVENSSNVSKNQNLFCKMFEIPESYVSSLGVMDVCDTCTVAVRKLDDLTQKINILMRKHIYYESLFSNTCSLTIEEMAEKRSKLRAEITKYHESQQNGVVVSGRGPKESDGNADRESPSENNKETDIDSSEEEEDSLSSIEDFFSSQGSPNPLKKETRFALDKNGHFEDRPDSETDTEETQKCNVAQSSKKKTNPKNPFIYSNLHSIKKKFGLNQLEKTVIVEKNYLPEPPAKSHKNRHVSSTVTQCLEIVDLCDSDSSDETWPTSGYPEPNGKTSQTQTTQSSSVKKKIKLEKEDDEEPKQRIGKDKNPSPKKNGLFHSVSPNSKRDVMSSVQFHCQKCKFLCQSSAALKYHIARKHTPEPELYKCTICNPFKTYKSHKSYMTHIKAHEANDRELALSLEHEEQEEEDARAKAKGFDC